MKADTTGRKRRREGPGVKERNRPICEDNLYDELGRRGQRKLGNANIREWGGAERLYPQPKREDSYLWYCVSCLSKREVIGTKASLYGT